MTHAADNWYEGGCHCGAVRYAFGEAPEFTFYCHCNDCQKTTGSPFSIELMLRDETFSVTGELGARETQERLLERRERHDNAAHRALLRDVADRLATDLGLPKREGNAARTGHEWSPDPGRSGADR